jgi:hypothetical protein
LGKEEKKKPLGKPRHKWVNNIKVDLGETGWGAMNRIDLAQDRDRKRALVKAVMNLWGFLHSCTTCGL